MPFGLEQNTGVSELDFAYRALARPRSPPAAIAARWSTASSAASATKLASSTTMATTRESNEPQFVAEGAGPRGRRTVVCRARHRRSVPPAAGAGRLQERELRRRLHELERAGGAQQPARRIASGAMDFFERVYVKGRRQRLGAQFDWTPGPTGAQGRVDAVARAAQAAEQPQRGSVGLCRHGVVRRSGTWFVTGEDKDDNVNPRHPFLRGGVGAIELAPGTRSSALKAPARRARLSRTRGRSTWCRTTDRVFTVGVNWITSKWTRVIVNAIHEDFEDATAYAGAWHVDVLVGR